MKKLFKGVAFATVCLMTAPLLTACDLFGGKVANLSGEKLQSEYISWNGRNYYDASTAQNYFFYATSGFTVDFVGTELEATFLGTQYSTAKRPVFAVTVDDVLIGDNKIKLYEDQQKVVLDETVIKLTSSTLDAGAGTNCHTVKLVDGLEDGPHSVTLYKLGEATDNTTALKSISTDGHFLKQSADDRLTVEMIGSSGITGYGALSYTTYNNAGRTSANSFGAMSLGGLSALMLNAKMSFMSVSGWTLAQNGSKISSIYDYVGRTENGTFKINGTAVPYTHKDVDIIILNIGGNDSTSLDLATLQPQEVNSFTAKMLQTHPSAKIVWTGRGNYGSRINGAVTALANPNVVYVGPIEGKGGENGDHYGANDHASIKTQLKNANMIMTKLETFGITKQRAITIQNMD